MMLRVLRITLMWLVALAVPIQGYAAAAMLGCGPEHHRMAGLQSQAATADSSDPAVEQHSPDAHAGMAGDHHHGDSAEPSHAHVLKMQGSSGKAGKGSCTPCASCCVVAALPTTVVVFEPVPPVDFFVPLAPRSVASFVTEGPERPPRSILV